MTEIGITRSSHDNSSLRNDLTTSLSRLDVFPCLSKAVFRHDVQEFKSGHFFRVFLEEHSSRLLGLDAFRTCTVKAIDGTCRQDITFDVHHGNLMFLFTAHQHLHWPSSPKALENPLFHPEIKIYIFLVFLFLRFVLFVLKQHAHSPPVDFLDIFPAVFPHGLTRTFPRHLTRGQAGKLPEYIQSNWLGHVLCHIRPFWKISGKRPHFRAFLKAAYDLSHSPTLILLCLIIHQFQRVPFLFCQPLVIFTLLPSGLPVPPIHPSLPFSKRTLCANLYSLSHAKHLSCPHWTSLQSNQHLSGCKAF